jgi:hypothetical protein
MKKKTSSREPRRSHSALPLVLVSLVVGVFMARWLGQRTRHLAGTGWSDVPELRGASLAELHLANGSALAVRDDSTAHIVYLFQYDCPACDAQRAHVAELLESVPNHQVISASAQAALLSPGYWGDLGSSLPAPVGADSSWLASRHMTGLPLLLFVDKSGKISKAIRGSVLGWSEHTLQAELAAAGAT